MDATLVITWAIALFNVAYFWVNRRQLPGQLISVWQAKKPYTRTLIFNSSIFSLFLLTLAVIALAVVLTRNLLAFPDPACDWLHPDAHLAEERMIDGLLFLIVFQWAAVYVCYIWQKRNPAALFHWHFSRS